MSRANNEEAQAFKGGGATVYTEPSWGPGGYQTESKMHPFS